MSKPAHPRTLADSEARAIARNLRTSPRKLNLVAQSIRGMKAGDALSALRFSKRRIAGDVRKCLQAAIANAENNHELDVDRLIVSEASVGKGLVMRRWMPAARGRSGKIAKAFSHITIVVRENEEKA
ncbi:MAG: 50S ribosomal protein L22 [Alphaproteobacteria bacterium]|nr:50S ribosomal protein L22 [Alphaproteobacteria bacterium]